MIFFNLIFYIALLAFTNSCLGTYRDKCTEYHALLRDNKWLGMYCFDDRVEIAGHMWTWLNIDQCFGNNAGYLAPRDNGHYTETCHQCRLRTKIGGQRLQCICNQMEKDKFALREIDMDPILEVTNKGALKCWDHVGNYTRFGPKGGQLGSPENGGVPTPTATSSAG